MTEKRKILVVEDEIPLAMMMVHLLMRAGYEVEAAGNLEKALRLAGSNTFDLITLDINLPDGNGFETYKSLKQLPHLRNTPVMFVTGAAHLKTGGGRWRWAGRILWKSRLARYISCPG